MQPALGGAHVDDFLNIRCSCDHGPLFFDAYLTDGPLIFEYMHV